MDAAHDAQGIRSNPGEYDTERKTLVFCRLYTILSALGVQVTVFGSDLEVGGGGGGVKRVLRE